MPATRTYVLIDLQNRRPAFEQVEAMIGTSGEAWVFFGDHELEFLPNYLQIGSQVSMKALTARIKSRFGKAATTKGIDDVLARLETMDVLTLANGGIKYVKDVD